MTENVEFDNMIEVELKNFRETAMVGCSKSLGLNLSMPAPTPKVEEKKIKQKEVYNIDNND